LLATLAQCIYLTSYTDRNYNSTKAPTKEKKKNKQKTVKKKNVQRSLLSV